MTAELDLTPETIKLIVERAKIETELEDLEVKYEKLKIRSEIEDIDYSKDLKNLEEKIKYLKTTRDGLGEIKFPLSTLIAKQNEVQERLTRLNEKRGQIQTEVFESLKNEYLDERTTLANEINQILQRFTELKQQATKGAKTLRYSIEELSIRKEIEGMEEDAYQQRLMDLKTELSHSEDLLAGIDYLLQLVKQ
ncbi:MAG: hypothetical protein EAX86_08425 [Candidatus Heimdallarchaeota archaeon]|nr:hypothetical protein [Candidatus Heimdallarchaeota archaeon]